MRLKPSSRLPELAQTTLGEALLAVHVSYNPVMRKVLARFNPPGQPAAVKGMAHITGGGFIDNIPRVLPRHCDVIIRKDSWDMPPLFHILQSHGGVQPRELYQVFNMGIGMTLIVAPAKAKAILRALRSARHPAWTIGEVVPGKGKVRLQRSP
jgi:phosphoribosylformylglycinamidine cyclo-ligase